jgi:hypothetical protein
MKIEPQDTIGIPASFLIQIVKSLPDPSTYPIDTIKRSFKTNINKVRPFVSEIDQEYDTTEVAFGKAEIMGKQEWVMLTITRTRTTIYLSDYFPQMKDYEKAH